MWRNVPTDDDEGRRNFFERMSNRQALEFLLVPDSGAARRVRRELANTSARSGVVVGTWPELLRRARQSYIIPESPETPGEFERAMARIEGVFWSKSLRAAPEETVSALRRALTEAISASDPDHGLEHSGAHLLSDRPKRFLYDLCRLADAVSERLPGDLDAIRRLLDARADDALYHTRVQCIPGVPHTTRWQDALIAKLNCDAGFGTDSQQCELATALRGCLEGGPRAESGTALGFLQSHLFERDGASRSVDSTLQWVRVRDFYQEAEIAAGMVQTLLSRDPALKRSEIGLLVPDSFEYSVAIEDAFSLAGLPLSGLPGERWNRDLGGEAVYHFLFCRQTPAPAMAQAVCLSSVLMPWTTQQGAQLAQEVMDGRYFPKLRIGVTPDQRRMLDLIAGSDAEPESVAKSLHEFVSLLRGGDSFQDHFRRARAAAGRVLAQLEGAKSINWSELRRAVAVGVIAKGRGPAFNLEGVTVWNERHVPWRDVRHLLVLGFSQGRYPQQQGTSPLFSEDDVRELREGADLPIDFRADRQARGRQLVRRQLQAVSDSATFLVPHLDPAGNRQAPSESFVFMRRLFAPGGSAPDLIADPDSAADRMRIRNLAIAADRAPQPPRNFLCLHLEIGRDLLALRPGKNGAARPLSPSSLELRLVSPLGWLLRQVGAEPQLWAPESASPSVVGTLAHSVFEELFRPAAPLPSRREMGSLVRASIDSVAAQIAPFFKGPHWHVERRNISKQLARAAKRWRDTLDELRAEVLGSEQWLQGEWEGVTVHGKCDLILGIKGDRLLMVDYKWSGSGSRRKRMEQGFDSQLSLYRAMAAGGGVEAPGGSAENGSKALSAKLRDADWIGIAYYTMKDHVCLSDQAPEGLADVRGWQAVDEQVDRNSSALISERLQQFRAGLVQLNTDEDREMFKQEHGIWPYAMDISPLIDLFAIPAARDD